MTGELAADILRASHRVSRLLEDAMRSDGLDVGSALLMARLQTAGPMTMSDVMRELDVRASSATSIVNRLENKGFVERVTNPSDARSLLVRLTARGRAAGRRASKALRDIDAVLQAVGTSAVRGHRKVLTALHSG
jgi:DNA-binding MarR family transcriptional regulator